MANVRKAIVLCLLFPALLTFGCAQGPSADYAGQTAYCAVTAEAEARGIVLSDEEEDYALACAKQDLLELESTQEAGLYTLEALTESYRYDLLFDKLSGIFVPDTGISETDLREWYDARYAALEKVFADNPGVFKSQQEQYDRYGGVAPLIVPEGYVRVHHILVADRETAGDVLDQLNAGADFDELADRFNIDEGMNAEPYRSLGYLIGPYDATRDYLPEIKEAALSIAEVGQISGVVESSAGFHIIRLDERLKAGSLPYEAVRAEISALLENNARKTQFETMVADWIQ